MYPGAICQVFKFIKKIYPDQAIENSQAAFKNFGWKNND